MAAVYDDSVWSMGGKAMSLTVEEFIDQYAGLEIENEDGESMKVSKEGIKIKCKARRMQ